MTLVAAIGLLLALGLMVYLVVALLYPEKFE
jgi:K+-transporting ATPase KdpF subunit